MRSEDGHNMHRWCCGLLLTFIALSCLWLQRAWCQSTDRTQFIDSAKKEGELVIYGSMNLRDANVLIGKFREKYPFIDVKLNRLTSDKLYARVISETRAGKFLADILENNALGLYFMKKAGLLVYYLSSEDRFYPKDFKDQGYWTTSNMNLHVTSYNTRRVARDQLPKKWEDLLYPAWKGKMMLNPSEQWFSWILQIMGKEKGLKYMRELSQLNLTTRSESAAMRIDLIAAGEAALDIDSTYGAVNLLKKRGAPIDWTTLGPVLVNLTGHGVAVRSPHPNAAKLFVDFILSQEGQRHVLSIDRWIIRSDLFSEQAAIKDLKLIPVNPALGENMEYYARQSREIFSK